MSIILLLHLFMLTFTFGHVELLTVDYHSIDTPIVELNNHTLREVFEDGNIFVNPYYNDLTIEFYSGAFETLLIANNRLEILANNQWEVAYKYTTLQSGTKLYMRFDVENFNNLTYIMYDNGSNYLPTNTVLDRKIQKGIVTINIENTTIQIADANTSFSMRYVYSNHAINLTILGISSLTVEQMDTYFQMYQDNISANDVTYTQNEMTITDLTYILGFSFVWFIIIWSIRKVVL